jgi:hypothetical protein
MAKNQRHFSLQAWATMCGLEMQEVTSILKSMSLWMPKRIGHIGITVGKKLPTKIYPLSMIM